RANRATPEPAPALTPDGPIVGVVHRQVDQANEQAINDLSTRINQSAERMERDYAFAQVNDRARTDFERSR
ncbi:unnamed protein product, partial [Discosporangium mesarthrocarpum]